MTNNKNETVSRRFFLGGTGAALGVWFFSAQSQAFSSGSGVIKKDKVSISFPHGVASADPQPDAVLFWTRVVPQGDKSDTVDLVLEVSKDMEFSKLILSSPLSAQKSDDYTVRAFVDNLEPDQYYYYRFIASDGTISRLGRTRTAPEPDSTRPVNFAFFSCQLYDQGFFTSYRHMINFDKNAEENKKIDFVLHLGDFIYESQGFFPFDLQGRPLDLKYQDGTPRKSKAFPSGGVKNGPISLAQSLDDYRFLYQNAISDPDLQAARAWFPFVCMWDDHEFMNDHWQSYTGTGALPKQKRDAAQAWFEYMPAVLSDLKQYSKTELKAKDFTPVDVENADATLFDDHYLSLEENNLKALNVMTLYRSLRWGKTLDLIVTDSRSYRSPSGAPDELYDSQGENLRSALEAIPTEAINIFAAGRTYNNGNPPKNVDMGNRIVPNFRRDSPAVTTLGIEQKNWFKSSLSNSDSTWKIWGNTIPAMRLGFDMKELNDGRDNGVVWTDCWDGYPNERNELMSYIRDQNITNVVSVTGDRHAHFAGLVMDDYDAVKPKPIVPEFACTGVSAATRIKVLGWQTKNNDLLSKLVRMPSDAVEDAGAANLNITLMSGVNSALEMAKTGDRKKAKELENPRQNPHVKYADTDAYGYSLAFVDQDKIEVAFVTVPEPIVDTGEEGPVAVRTTWFTVNRWDNDGEPMMIKTRTDGTPLFSL